MLKGKRKVVLFISCEKRYGSGLTTKSREKIDSEILAACSDSLANIGMLHTRLAMDFNSHIHPLKSLLQADGSDSPFISKFYHHSLFVFYFFGLNLFIFLKYIESGETKSRLEERIEH